MKAIRQEHFSGCAVACVASVSNSSYRKAIKNFTNGNEWAKFRGFYCREIIDSLEKMGFNYSLKYVKRKKSHIYPIGTIVFIGKTEVHPVGHYLLFTEKGWMDPWINFPRLNAKAGFRKKLPGKPVYAIVK